MGTRKIAVGLVSHPWMLRYARLRKKLSSALRRPPPLPWDGVLVLGGGWWVVVFYYCPAPKKSRLFSGVYCAKEAPVGDGSFANSLALA